MVESEMGGLLRPTKLSKCPGCGHYPLIVEYEKGTFDFTAVCCGVELEPDAKALIEVLKDKKIGGAYEPKD